MLPKPVIRRSIAERQANPLVNENSKQFDATVFRLTGIPSPDNHGAISIPFPLPTDTEPRLRCSLVLPENSVEVFAASSDSDGPRTTPGQSAMTSDASIVACDDCQSVMCKETRDIFVNVCVFREIVIIAPLRFRHWI